MARSGCKLQIFALDDAEEGRDRALLIVDALASKRPMDGCGPWIATYPAATVSEAFASCVEDLDAIDPRWVEVLDFVVIQARSRAARERGRPAP